MNSLRVVPVLTASAVMASFGMSLLFTPPIASAQHSIPLCQAVIVSEDFESCDTGTWIGDCSEWQTWANGQDPAYFFITDQEHVSGAHALQVSGSGWCWEGSAYKEPLPPTSHILLRAQIKASGDGPNGCHHRQNGIEIGAASWNFDMGGGERPEGLNCSACGAGYFTAISGFQNAVGRWYSVAIELDYSLGQAFFWLDGRLVWATAFDTNCLPYRLWMSSGEGRGWFDDVLVCEVAPANPVGAMTWGSIKSLYR